MAQARGMVKVDIEECKGCGLCIDACPPKCLELEPKRAYYQNQLKRFEAGDPKADIPHDE